MINNWWVTRPKRKLTSVPEDLAVVATAALNQEWVGDRTLHLKVEEGLEASGLKREGDRRDQGGGGGRTYVAWLKSLGLLFSQNATKKLMLTLAGEELLSGRNPTLILTNQILKYQFPSAFSISPGVRVNSRFRIRPFRFLFRLLLDDRIEYLTQDEIAKIVITEAENETEECYSTIVKRILEFREKGDACLPVDFEVRYPSTRQGVKTTAAERLNDVANTIVNWMEYTQYIVREGSGRIRIHPEKIEHVQSVFLTNPPLIDRCDDEEFFQRKFGVDPWHNKDVRNLLKTATVTASVIEKSKVRQAFLAYAACNPVLAIDSDVVQNIARVTGVSPMVVEDALGEMYPRGAFGSFLPAYNEMAFSGKEQATQFELATASLFKTVFGFATRHVGPIGKTPDVLLLSDQEGFQAILDNKAYSSYSITNDHMNRMVVNYIQGLRHYSDSDYRLSFFSYIAGGFASGIDKGINAIRERSGINGSAISVGRLSNLMTRHIEHPYSHAKLRDIFSVNRQIGLSDFDR